MKFGIFDRLSRRMVHRLKWGLTISLQNKSFSHSSNLHNQFFLFYRLVLRDADTIHHRIELSHILTFKSRLDAATEWKLGVVRILLTDMENLGFGIASNDALEYLAAATIRGNRKGTSIRTRDAEKGAFTDTELLAIQSALNDAYAQGDIDLTEFAITWLFLAYGPRPIQIAAMKEKDLIVSENDEGRLYALRMPRAKQRGERARDSFKIRYCGKQVGTLLEQVVKDNQRRRRELGFSEDCPMFIAGKEGQLPNLRFHMTSDEVGRVVNNTIGHLTGLKTNARRFRITLAQRAVDDGKDKHTVAELLDHSDTQNVEVYYEASPAMVLRLDRHLAMEMAPLAHAFAGVVVSTEQDALRGDDRSSRIFDRSLNNVAEALGTCGQMSFCGLAAPFACYTCRHFQPWIDGPHEEFMAALIADRDRMEAEGYSSKIYTIRDRTILAAAEVIQLCAAEKEIRAEVAA
ncbi:site-specific integrase [Ensifer sp. IC4062]|nr:site-specific integrase [Ensifer sp. IC4062]